MSKKLDSDDAAHVAVGAVGMAGTVALIGAAFAAPVAAPLLFGYALLGGGATLADRLRRKKG